jgi:hypothetical protein
VPFDAACGVAQDKLDTPPAMRAALSTNGVRDEVDITVVGVHPVDPVSGASSMRNLA